MTESEGRNIYMAIDLWPYYIHGLICNRAEFPNQNTLNHKKLEIKT